MNKSILASELKRLRGSLSRIQMANKLRVSLRTIVNWEDSKSRVKPSYTDLVAMLALLDNGQDFGHLLAKYK